MDNMYVSIFVPLTWILILFVLVIFLVGRMCPTFSPLRNSFSTSEGVQAALALPEIPSGYRAVAGDHDKKKSKKMKASRKRNRSDTEGPFSLDEPLEKESGR